MTDEMFNRSTFLPQDHRQSNQHVNNNSTDVYDSSLYDGISDENHQSGSTSNFYILNQNNSSETPPEYVHHTFPNSGHNNWRVENSGVSALSLAEGRRVENSGVSALSLAEGSTRENSTNSSRLQEVYKTDNIEELTSHVRRKLVQTRQMDRLNELVERRLSEVGWRLDMMAYSRAIVKKHGGSITFDTLFQEIKTNAREKIPQDVQDEVVEKIKYCYESAIPSED